MRIAVVVLLLTGCGCDSETSRTDWYGVCRIGAHDTFDFTLQDLGPAPEGAILGGSVGDWKLFEGAANVTSRNRGLRAEGAPVTHAICEESDSRDDCLNQRDPYVATEALFDIRLDMSDVGGHLVLKGLPDDPDAPTRYTGECRHNGVSGRAGTFELSRQPLPVDAGAGMPSDAGRSCTAPALACGDTCVDVSADSSHCGVCGNACADGACVLGRCPEQRARRRALAMGRDDACVIRGGDVLCFRWTGASSGPITSPATVAYDGGDATQAVIYDAYLCFSSTDGTMQCMRRGDPSSSLITEPPAWSGMLDLSAHSYGLSGVDATGQLLWHDLPASSTFELPSGVSFVRGQPSDLGCWQELAGPVRCKSGGQEDPYSPGPMLDFAYGGLGAFGIDGAGELLWLFGTEEPQRLDQDGALQVAAGLLHASALTADGQVHNFIRQEGIRDPLYAGPAFGLDDAVAIAAVGYHTCAERSDRTVTCWRSDEVLTLHDVDLSAGDL